jgi:putative ABC transport system ATP-binding protein
MSSMRFPLIQLHNVTRRFLLGETIIEALCKVSLTIYGGEFLAVWGPSGSGKSTLMNLIGLIDSPTTGEIYFETQNTRQLNDNELTKFRGNKIGFVFQNFNLIPVLSALENVMLPLQLRGVNTYTTKINATKILEEVGLKNFITARPDKLSGGQRQRVAIARALVIAPKLVIADEPTANLDSNTSKVIIELMREMNRIKNVTFIFTTHDPRLLEHVDRRILLNDGQIETDEILQ